LGSFGSATGGGIGKASSNGDVLNRENFEMRPCEEEQEEEEEIRICHHGYYLDHLLLQNTNSDLSHRGERREVLG